MTTDPTSQSIDIEFGALWAILSRRKWPALGVFLAVTAVGTLVTMRTPRIYRATATVMIERNTPDVLSGVREVYDLGAGRYWNPVEYYNTQYRVIRSRPVAERVVVLLGLHPETLVDDLRAAGPASLEAVAARDSFDGLPRELGNRLHLLGFSGTASREEIGEGLLKLDAAAYIQRFTIVEGVKDSRLADISIEDTDPDRAAIIANAVADAYEDVNLDYKISTTRTAVSWLSDQIKTLKDKAAKSDLALFEFKKANNIVSVSMEDRQTMIAQTLSQLNGRLSDDRASYLELASRHDQVQEVRQGEVDAGTIPAVMSNPLIQDLKSKLATLRQEQSDLALKYTPSHPKVLGVTRKMALIEDTLARETSRILESLDGEYEAAMRTERRLRSAIDEVKNEALAINKKEIQYNRLRRERDNNQALYDLVLKRQKEADLSQMLKVNNVRKLEAALPPKLPIRPNVRLNILVAVLLGLVGGLGLAFAVDYLDNTLKTQAQVEEYLALPLLGIIPAIRGEKSAHLVDAPERDHYVISHPRSSIAECSRSIRTNLLFMSPDQPARSLLITSSNPREGKSTTVVNLAVTMAQSGARTAIVDTDLRRPRLHKSFAVDNDIGISSAIVGNATLDEMIRPTGVEGLDLYTCGPIPPNPAELLLAERFQHIVAELKQRYERVLFDSPPVAAVTDALILSSMVDGVVLVVQAGQTSRHAAKQASARLADVGARVFGVVLNDVDLQDKRSGGYYEQYYYYRQGYGYGEDAEREESGGNKAASA